MQDAAPEQQKQGRKPNLTKNLLLGGPHPRHKHTMPRSPTTPTAQAMRDYGFQTIPW